VSARIVAVGDDGLDWWSDEYQRQLIAQHKARKAAFLKAVGGWLKGYGFRRDGKVFRRPFGTDTQIIDFQANRSGTCFFVEIGVHFPEMHELMGFGPEVLRSKHGPTVADCMVVTDLSMLVSGPPPQLVTWDTVELDWVCEQIEALGLPWLELASSPDFESPHEQVAEATRAMWAARLANRTSFVRPPSPPPASLQPRPRHDDPGLHNHELVIEYSVSDDESAGDEESDLLSDLVREVNALAVEAKVGYSHLGSLVEGVGQVLAFGPDADALLRVVEPYLQSRLRGRNGRVTLRSGRPFFPNTIERCIEME
jgi:hypothetical protein